MNKYLPIFLLLLLGVFIYTSCKEDGNVAESESQRDEHLLQQRSQIHRVAALKDKLQLTYEIETRQWTPIKEELDSLVQKAPIQALGEARMQAILADSAALGSYKAHVRAWEEISGAANSSRYLVLRTLERAVPPAGTPEFDSYYAQLQPLVEKFGKRMQALRALAQDRWKPDYQRWLNSQQQGTLPVRPRPLRLDTLPTIHTQPAVTEPEIVN